MTDSRRRSAGRRASRTLFEPYREARADPGAGQPRAHPHLSRADRPGGVAGAGRRAAAAPGVGAARTIPAVGDWVAVEPPRRTAGDARIKAVLPRFSRFSRRAAGDATEEQIVAANIDTVFLVGGLDHDFNPRRLERYLAGRLGERRHPGHRPEQGRSRRRIRRCASTRCARSRRRVEIHAVTIARPESLEPLLAHLAIGRTGALLGSSGVGKSSIVNSLVGHELLRDHDVRESDSRGRHTSTNRQLVLLPGGGLLIDTPGHARAAAVGRRAAGARPSPTSPARRECRFRDCRHRSEPGCAVTVRRSPGELAENRLESFRKLDVEREHSRASAGRARADRAQASGPDRGQGAPASTAQGPDRRRLIVPAARYGGINAAGAAERPVAIGGSQVAV